VLLPEAVDTEDWARGLSLIPGLAAGYHVVTVVQATAASIDAVTAASGTTVALSDDRDMIADEARWLAIDLRAMATPLFAVATSLGCAVLATALEEAGVPVVGLVQDHDDSGPREESLHWYFARVTALVYTADIVARSVAQRYVTAGGRSDTVAAFAIDRYIALIDELGRRAATVRVRQERDLRTVLVPGGFDADLYSGGLAAGSELLARDYLQRLQSAAPLGRPLTGLIVQRPCPGFHPLAYAESAPGFVDDGSDPLAHYLRAGRPAGRWAKRVITPARDSPAGAQPGGAPRVIVHGHFHYSDMLTSFLDMLSGNRAPATLVLTTTGSASVDELQRIAQAHPAGHSARVLLVPNRGRNLSALFTGPVADMVRDHDLVLHVHGKRSPHLDACTGQAWRRFLWAHLVGDGFALADQIVDEFASCPRLGLVAPEDRHLNDWDANLGHVPRLLARLGRTMTLPVHFDFALGAMFWARTAALRPFLDVGLSLDDYPAEPLDHDGSALHALERLIPLVVEAEGFEFAKTHLSTVRR